MQSIIEDLSVDIWEDPEDYAPSYNIAPTHQSPILIQENKRIVRPMRWGLIPSWAKAKTFGANTINARNETLLEKPTYRNLVHQKRCIVLADGYYEWSRNASGKTPHYIYSANNSLLLMAGLWDLWSGGKDLPISSYTIITAPATEELASIHPRMPVMFTPETADAWIDTDKNYFETLFPFLEQYNVPLQHHTVSNKVNKVNYNSADCISPFIYPPQTTLF